MTVKTILEKISLMLIVFFNMLMLKSTIVIFLNVNIETYYLFYFM